MTPRLLLLLIGIVWAVTVVYLFHVLGCSPSTPC